MPYSRTSSGYPAAIRALLEEVAADNLPRAVTFATPRQAHGQRSRLYAFLAAVKRDLRLQPEWLGEAERDDLKAFLQRALTLEFVVKDRDLIIRPRDESPVAEAFRQARILSAAAPEASAEAGTAPDISTLLEKINARPTES